MLLCDGGVGAPAEWREDESEVDASEDVREVLVAGSGAGPWPGRCPVPGSESACIGSESALWP